MYPKSQESRHLKSYTQHLEKHVIKGPPPTMYPAIRLPPFLAVSCRFPPFPGTSRHFPHFLSFPAMVGNGGVHCGGGGGGGGGGPHKQTLKVSGLYLL